MKSLLRPEDLHFESIKKHQGRYLTEYQPPIPGYPFSTLYLMFLVKVEPEEVARLMEAEAGYWLSRYPVPVMVFASDETDNSLPLDTVRPQRYLAAFYDEGEKIICWEDERFSAFLKQAPNLVDLRKIFFDVPFKTQADVITEANDQARAKRKLERNVLATLSVWVGVIPASLIILEFFSPAWLSALISSYALWKVFQNVRKVWGFAKPWPSEAERAEKEAKMRHYFYHCERNPRGSLRLRSENFEEDERKRTRATAEELLKEQSGKSEK